MSVSECVCECECVGKLVSPIATNFLTFSFQWGLQQASQWGLQQASGYSVVLGGRVVAD